ncbi:MAG: hypothetical protein Q4F81_03670 [Eubacteriales bacterium]|nr:hypothetical protein [Eubacteriales bacterium]
MENKICKIKSDMEKRDVYCTTDCGYYCDACTNTKCSLTVIEDAKAAKLWEAYKMSGKLRLLLSDIRKLME